MRLYDKLLSDSMNDIVLYDYWRSSASYRVRIALNLKGLPFRSEHVDLVKGEHRGDAHREFQPLGLVPAIKIGERVLTQSLAIIGYIDNMTPPPKLIPSDVWSRAHVEALAHAVAMDIHPVCNLHVVAHVMEITGGGDDAKASWMNRFISSGLSGFEAMLQTGEAGDYCFGDRPTIADCCLIPQLYNAQRWGVDYSMHSNIIRVEKHCEANPAFEAALPENSKPR